MFETLLLSNDVSHRYTLASIGLKFRSEEFTSRQAAEQRMYKVMNKHHLHVENIWNDGHYKTYLCNNNVRFFINRI